MRRKLLTIGVTMMALTSCAAAASVAAASNEPALTYPTGTILAPGTKVKAPSIGGFKLTDGSGSVLWECTSNQLTGTLRKNNGSELEADIESVVVSGTGAEGRCTQASNMPVTDWIVNPETKGLPWCMRSTPAMKEDEVQIRGGSCSGVPRAIRTVLRTTIPTTEGPTDIIDCVYERTSPIVGTYTTDSTGDAILTFTASEWLKTEGSFSCWTAWKLDMTVTLERDEGTASPLYIS